MRSRTNSASLRRQSNDQSLTGGVRASPVFQRHLWAEPSELAPPSFRCVSSIASCGRFPAGLPAVSAPKRSGLSSENKSLALSAPFWVECFWRLGFSATLLPVMSAAAAVPHSYTDTSTAALAMAIQCGFVVFGALTSIVDDVCKLTTTRFAILSASI